MASNTTSPIYQESPLGAALILKGGVELPDFNMERSAPARHESYADRERFRRYEASRKQGAKREPRRVVIDGFIRYADKAYVAERPRPASPEYIAFKAELALAKAAKELF